MKRTNYVFGGRRDRAFAMLVFALLLLLVVALPAVAQNGVAPATVENIITIAHFGTDEENDKDSIFWSPDRTRVAVIEGRGSLAGNYQEFVLRVYRAAELMQSGVKPEGEIRRRAVSSNWPPIHQVTWRDENILLFLGATGPRVNAIFEWRVGDREQKQLTGGKRLIRKFATGNGAVIYYAEVFDEAEVRRKRETGFVVPYSMDMMELIKWPSMWHTDGLGYYEASSKAPLEVRIASKRVEDRSVFQPVESQLDYFMGIYPSPDGSKVLVGSRTVGERARKWILVDLKSGTHRSLAPGMLVSGSSSNIAWLPGGSAVSVTNVYSTDATDLQAPRHSAEVDVATGRAVRIPAVNTPPTSNGPVGLKIEEGVEKPPVLVATDTSGKTNLVLDPNAGLNDRIHLSRRTEEEVIWEKGEAKDRYVLHWPANYQPGKRYPLSIQGHGRTVGQFRPFGFCQSCYVGQPLASEGFFVAQMHPSYARRYEQGRAYDSKQDRGAGGLVEKVEALIADLDRRGLVDASKLSVSGISTDVRRWQYFMAHSKYKVSAASLCEGFEGGYIDLILGAANGENNRPEYEAYIDGAQLWSEKGVKAMAEFHVGLAKIETPTRFDSGMGSYFMIESFMRMRRQNRPAELFMNPRATHNRIRPRDIFATGQGTVDWIKFWVLGQERTVPVAAAGETVKSLREQYTRWRRMREKQTGLKPDPEAAATKDARRQRRPMTTINEW